MTGAFATPALAAKQTLAFTAVQTSPDGPVTKDKLVDAHGKIIGHDVFSCKHTSVKNVVACTDVSTFTAPKKGTISVKLNVDFSAKSNHGVITGGTGAYAGAKGTAKGTSISAKGTKVKVVLTITY